MNNDAVRKHQRSLSPSEQAYVDQIKDLGQGLLDVLTSPEYGGSGEAVQSREMALARTKVEEAVMWAVKAATK